MRLDVVVPGAYTINPCPHCGQRATPDPVALFTMYDDDGAMKWVLCRSCDLPIIIFQHVKGERYEVVRT